MNDYAIIGYLALLVSIVLAIFGIVSNNEKTKKFSIPVFLISLSLFLAGVFYQSLTGKSPIDILIARVIDPIVRLVGAQPASDQLQPNGTDGDTSPQQKSQPIQWKLARGDRNSLGYGLIAQDPRTDVVFSVYCNRSFDEGGWNVSLRFPETPAGRDSFKRITGSFQPLYGTYRTFEFDISPSFNFAMPLQISPNTRQRVQMVFSSESPGAGGRPQWEIPALLREGSNITSISFEGFELLGEVSADGFADLLTREAISDDCSLDKL